MTIDPRPRIVLFFFVALVCLIVAFESSAEAKESPAKIHSSSSAASSSAAAETAIEHDDLEHYLAGRIRIQNQYRAGLAEIAKNRAYSDIVKTHAIEVLRHHRSVAEQLREHYLNNRRTKTSTDDAVQEAVDVLLKDRPVRDTKMGDYLELLDIDAQASKELLDDNKALLRRHEGRNFDFYYLVAQIAAQERLVAEASAIEKAEVNEDLRKFAAKEKAEFEKQLKQCRDDLNRLIFEGK